MSPCIEAQPIAKPLICLKCHTILGASTENYLAIGGVRFNRVVTLMCAECGWVRVWRPQVQITFAEIRHARMVVS